MLETELIKGITNIRVSPETKERLRKLGEKDQSYEDVLSNLLDISAKAYEEEREKKRRQAR